MNRIQKWALGAGMALGSMLVASTAFMASDPDVVSTTNALATSMKDNVTGVLSANVVTLSIAGLIIIGVFVVWKIGRRFVGR